jgi:hypothetical protein
MFSMPLSTRRSTIWLRFARACRHGGQVGHGAHALFALDARDQIEGAVARRAARAVGDGHEVRGKIFQIVDGARQVGRPSLGLGRKELEREQALA